MGVTYFFFILSPDNRVSAFRSELDDANLVGMRDNIPEMRASGMSGTQYERAAQAFCQAPDPANMKILDWVCRDDPAYLDLENDSIDLPPIG